MISFKKKKRTTLTDKDKLNNLLHKTRILSETNDMNVMLDLIRMILRPIQANHIVDAYYHKNSPLESLEFPSAMFSKDLNYLNEDMLRELNIKKYLDPTNYQVHLATDMIFPTSWSNASMTRGVLGKIGHKEKPFIESSNHDITLILPFNISFVNNGNHSIAQGVIAGDGILHPSLVYDFTETLHLIEFNGENWKSDYKYIKKPIYPEFGYIWEVAKLFYCTNNGQ